MLKIGDVISYIEMCKIEGVNLQRGMNFHLRGGLSVILMSLRAGAPYNDRIENEGRILIYEGHDVSKNYLNANPKSVDQPMSSPKGRLTQNGLFFEAVKKPLDAKEISKQLGEFLDSERVCSKTDDDKTLVILGKIEQKNLKD